MGRLGVLFIACTFCACASHNVRLTCPEHGGPSWVRADTANFHVLTDLDSKEAESIARGLEQSLDTLAQAAFWHSRSAPAPTTVVVLRDEAEFHAFLPDSAEGAFYRQLPSDLASERVMVLCGELSYGMRINWMHELTHDLLPAILVRRRRG